MHNSFNVYDNEKVYIFLEFQNYLYEMYSLISHKIAF